MGIEFSYAAETAFVSPTLLKIGVKHQHMTLVWALSPLVGFFVTPILGSISDRCRLNLGRRRPFIILLSIGVFVGNWLQPSGDDLAYSQLCVRRVIAGAKWRRSWVRVWWFQSVRNVSEWDCSPEIRIASTSNDCFRVRGESRAQSRTPLGHFVHDSRHRFIGFWCRCLPKPRSGVLAGCHIAR